MIFVKGAAKRETALILDKGSRQTRAVRAIGSHIVKEIAGIKESVLMEPVSTAMELVATALGDDLDLRAGISAELSVKIIADQLKFLHAIVAERAGPSFTSGGKITTDNAVNGNVVGASARTVGVKAAGSQERVVL